MAVPGESAGSVVRQALTRRCFSASGGIVTELSTKSTIDYQQCNMQQHANQSLWCGSQKPKKEVQKEGGPLPLR